jgi:hypothetical protein
MSGAGQPPRDEAPTQAAADDGEIGLLRARVHRRTPGAREAMPVMVTGIKLKTEE